MKDFGDKQYAIIKTFIIKKNKNKWFSKNGNKEMNTGYQLKLV